MAQILVVEDCEDQADLLCDLLEAEGYEAVCAANGLEALKLLRGGLRPDVILSDIDMPGLDGYGLLEALLADRELSGIPVVMLSALDHVNPPAALVLRKPADGDFLCEALAACLAPRVAASR